MWAHTPNHTNLDVGLAWHVGPTCLVGVGLASQQGQGK
jgi:hypothetical protein